MVRIEYTTLPVSENDGNGILPSIGKDINVQNVVNNVLTEQDELFLGYGARHNSYPYTVFDNYGELKEKRVKTAVLENDKMRAVFLLKYGGRLWQLLDKTTGQNLVYTNDCIKLGNLAIRNAWFSGGIEWNMGYVGHSPFTCQNVYAEKVTADGIEILRLYEFERVRQVSWQIDFWLNDEKPRLYARMRLVNKDPETKPMYWWSNIASPQYKGGRIFADADHAYKTDSHGVLSRVEVPYDKDAGTDVSHYCNLYTQVDYFFDTADAEKYIVNIDETGNGLLQYSTRRLKGRKLFYWGNRVSSSNWQKTLTNCAGDYIELQSGLAKTQYESIPMPPNTAWEWIECYEKAALTPEFSQIDYATANEILSARVRKSIEEDDLENMLNKTRSLAFTRGELIHEGSGFGFLYNLLHDTKLDGHLQFREQQDISDYLYLVRCGTLPEKKENEAPKEFAYSKEIGALLEKAIKGAGKRNWYNYYQLAMLESDADHLDRAKRLARKSIALYENLYNDHLMMWLERRCSSSRCVGYAEKVLQYSENSYTAVSDALNTLFFYKKYREMESAIVKLEAGLREKARIRLYLVFALAHQGKIEEAEELLLKDGGLSVADIREGEDSLDEAYLLVLSKKFPGKSFKYEDIPSQFRFKLKDN